MISSKSFQIVVLEKKHLEPLRMLRNSPDTNTFLTSILPITEAEQEVWFQKMSLDQTQLYFALEGSSGDLIGVIRCDEWDKVNRSIRIGLDIHPSHRRKGYATEAYNTFLTYLFTQLGLHRVWLLVASFNTPAKTLYKKLGFKEEGVMRDALYREGKFHDYIVMSILSTEYETIHTR